MAKTQPKTRQEIDSTAIELTEMFVDLVNRELTATAFCIDLARTALGWELAGDQKQARKAVKKAFALYPKKEPE